MQCYPEWCLWQPFGEQCPDGWFSIGTDSLGYPKPLKIALCAAARFCETLMLSLQHHSIMSDYGNREHEDSCCKRGKVIGNVKEKETHKGTAPADGTGRTVRRIMR